MSHWTSRRPGWMPLLLTVVFSAVVGAWAITGPAAAAPTHHPVDSPSSSGEPRRATAQPEAAAIQATAHAAAEVAAWTRVVVEGQRRVFALTGRYVPVPEASPPATAQTPDATAAPVSPAAGGSPVEAAPSGEAPAGGRGVWAGEGVAGPAAGWAVGTRAAPGSR